MSDHFKSSLEAQFDKRKSFAINCTKPKSEFFGRNTSDVKDHNNEKLDVKDNNKENLMSNTTTMKTLCRRSQQRDLIEIKIEELI